MKVKEKISKSRVQVSTRFYEYNRDCKPRGYGEWGFAFKTNCDINDVIWFTGNYSDVKKQAIEAAANAGEYMVHVMP